MLAASILSACTTVPGSASHQPPIVWISLDTVRADHLDLYGGRAAMPTLAAFAKGAVVFDHAYSHFPQTQQSHWSMFTSTLPEVHRYAADSMASPYGGVTLASHLAANGYATGAFIGGMTLTAQASHLQRGFDTYDDHGDWGMDRDLRPAPEVRAAAVKWMADQDGAFFAFVHLFDAHSPYTPRDPRRYDTAYTGRADGSLAILRSQWDRPWMSQGDVDHVVALYDAELTELDAELGPLLDALPPEAIVVISSDHGESFEHGYLLNHPEVVYDSVLHVPLVISAPGSPPARVAAQVGLMDVAPTVLALAGLPPLPEAMGTPLLPQTTAHVPLYARSRAAPGGRALLAVRTPTEKGVFEEEGDSWAFDLVKDPDEDTRVPLSAALIGEERRYLSLVAPLLALWPATPPTGGPPSELRLRLEALGYSSGPGAPPPPPGAPPPPPGAPAGHPP